MIGPAVRALPMRVGIGTGGLTKRVPLGETAGFGVASLQLLDLRDQQPEPTLIDPVCLRGLRCRARLGSQASVEGRSRQQYPAFRMLSVTLN
jgi:hypothetical protein